MRSCLAIALALLSCSAAADVEPGSWELSLVTMMTGQPKPAAVTQTRCLNSRDPSSVLGGAQSGTCTFTNKHDSGSVFTFDVSCTGALPMKGKGSVTYTQSSMQADLDLSADEGKFGMRTFVSGRRLGPC
jgi:uncharacterized protein DUF3617